MKKIFTLFALFVCLAVIAQQKVANKVTELKSLGATFTFFSPLDLANQPVDAEVSRVVKNSTLAKINTVAINDIVANEYQTIQISIPYRGENILIDLYKVNPFSENFHVDTDKDRAIPYRRGVHYRGIVKDDVNSIASFNFFNGEFNGIVSAREINNLVVGKLDRPGNTNDYIVYSDAEMLVLNDFNCGVSDEVDQGHDRENTSRNALTDRCVTMYFEIDYNIYQQNGSSETATANWMTSAFNNMQTLYDNDGITISLKSMYIWTEEDPYNTENPNASSADYLFMFNQVRPVFDGDVGQLVGVDPGGLGGVAIRINGLCTQNNFSYSDVSISVINVPTWSWTVQVITHEMGHLLGSRHTHACVWNGNGTSIDGCGTVSGFEEGNCVTGPIPSPMVKGTIMSYCHLVSGVGISFANGFGPQPTLAIINAVEGAACLSTDCVSTCINTVVDVTAIFPSNNSATITWNDLGGATQWQVAVSTFGSTIDNWVTVDTNSYTTPANLNINAYYKIKIRPVCDNATANHRVAIFATPGIWCNGVTITDTGGAFQNYTDNQSYVRTLIPSQPQKKIRVEFTSFDLEEDYDFLTIYDGSTTTAPLIGEFTGSFIISPIESSSPDGSITLKFFSDQGVVAPGYIAQVSCLESLAVSEVDMIDFSYWPNPTNGTVNILSNTEIENVTVYNVQGRLLYQSKSNGLNKTVDISAFSSGTYFFKLNFAGDKQTNFRIIRN